MGPHVLLVDGGGGSAPAASDGNSLDAAITAAQAFNTSWQQAVREIAGQINASAGEAVNAVNAAKEQATLEIFATKLAAIRAVEAAKPKSSWLDELDRPPGWKPGDPR